MTDIVMPARLEDLQTVEGIGAKTAGRIRWATNEDIAPMATKYGFRFDIDSVREYLLKNVSFRTYCKNRPTQKERP